MAGLLGLKILLFWAGTITLVNCQGPPAPSVTSLSSSSSPPRTMAATSAMSPTSPRTMAATSAMSPTSPRTMAATSAMSPSSPRTIAATSAMSPTSPDTMAATSVMSPPSPRTMAATSAMSPTSPDTTAATSVMSPPSPRTMAATSVMPPPSPRTMAATSVMSPNSTITESTTRPQTSTQPPPVLTPMPATVSPSDTSLTPTTVSTNKATGSQTNTTSNTQPLPSSNQPSTTVVPSNTGQPNSTTAAPCSYNISAIKFGLNIDIMSSSSGQYNLTITETALNESLWFNLTSSRNITPLKPCTEYSHSLEFNGSKCNPVGNSDIVHTSEMKKNDVEDGSCPSLPRHVCYRSKWGIRSSVSASNNVTAEQCPEDTSVFCIKPGNDDFCTELTTTFTSGNCPSFSRIKNISFDDFEIQQQTPTGLPVQGKDLTPLPPNCKDVTPEYSCQETGSSTKVVKLRDLEPFTEYNCTGQINQNNRTIQNITAVMVKVDCDLEINPGEMRSTDTSIKLGWTPYSNKCKVNFTKFKKLKYDCRCTSPKGEQYSRLVPSNGCSVDGLKPYTDYTCTVQPTYYGRPVGTLSTVKEKTDIGIPERVTVKSVSHPENNVIKVTCDNSGEFNGPKKKYTATLSHGSKTGKPQDNLRNCEFEFKDLSYSTTYTLEVRAFNTERGSLVTTQEVTTYYNDKAVIGFLVFLIILTSVALLLVVYKIFILKRRRSENLCETIPLMDEENLLPVEPITAELLLDSYKRKLADEGRLFLAEFQSIPRIYSRFSVKEAKKPCNSPKNRYVDILPYDHNRVHLTTGKGEGCDYINASFIDGYKEPKKYIAAQGPKEETLVDFWRMVWEQQSSIIVMVTRCEEGNRVKCAQYWPTGIQEVEIFGEFVVKLISEDEYPDYIIRRISLINKQEKGSEREVTHIQFISWPDHGVPGEPHLLLKLRRRVNSFKNLFSGPIVVHCSAGVGRTGTYIGIDAMMESLDAEGSVDIYDYVVTLRKQRCLMVQVEPQYILIHQALLEHNQFGETEITLPELHSSLSTLRQKTLDSEDSLMKEEFERLPTFKDWRTYNTGKTEENKKKNRSSSAIPYDYNRVLLKLEEERSQDSDPEDEDDDESSDEDDEESTKYINASHIDGYWGPRSFIAAQTPLPDTRADFWSMVYQKKAYAIVMLSECNEGEEDSDCIYWDKDKKTYGDLEVEVTSTEITPTFTTRNMLLQHVKRKESRPVKHFQFLKWGNNELPEQTQTLTDLIKEMKHSGASGKSQGNNPIVVHCNNGSARTGVFCALWNVLDSAETEKLVDVFQVAKTLRKERQGILSSLEQYQFLYSALEGVFPVQNGDVKAAQSSAADSVQIVNETKAAAAAEQPSEEKPEQPASTTSNSQQGEAESTPKGAEGETEDQKEEAEKVPAETKPAEDTSNGPTVTVEV